MQMTVCSVVSNALIACHSQHPFNKLFVLLNSFKLHTNSRE